MRSSLAGRLRKPASDADDLAERIGRIALLQPVPSVGTGSWAWRELVQLVMSTDADPAKAVDGLARVATAIRTWPEPLDVGRDVIVRETEEWPVAARSRLLAAIGSETDSDAA